MAHYAKHGHVPSDDEIAKHGLRAFAPTRDPYEPTKDDWLRASRDVATGPPDELRDLSVEVADYWPGVFFPLYWWGADD